MKIKFILHNVKDYSALYNNVVCQAMSEDWHFTHVENACMLTSFHYRFRPIELYIKAPVYVCYGYQFCLFL